jgi:membrane fusion protein (multidrug efflux system)
MFRHLLAHLRRRRRLRVLGPTAVCIAALTLAGCGGDRNAVEGAARDVAVDVVTAHAASQAVTRVLRVTGSLTADEEAEVAAETAGRVIETPVERGSRVTAGSPLLRVVDTEAQAQVQEAEANVAQIEVRLGVTGRQEFDVERIPEVMNARAAKELAGAEFGRIKRLYDEKVVSGSEFDQRRTQVEVTERAYDTARNNGRQLFRQLEAARARLTLARKALADTIVRSPFAGIVVERKVSVGDFVTRGLKVVTVVRITPLRVELTVPEQDVTAVGAGQSLALAVDAYPGRTFIGEVRFVSPAVRADQRALIVEAALPNTGGLLKPGMFATAVIEVPGKERGLFVPSAAIRNLAGSMRVYVVKSGIVEERLVTIGQRVGDAVEIVNGVAEGDELAASNLDRLADGAKVRVTGSAPPAAAARPASERR